MPKFNLNPLQRSIGVELEFADFGPLYQQYYPHAVLSKIKFDFVRDSSVHPSGLELVSAPMLGDDYPMAMGQLLNSLDPKQVVANSSCGFHVHVDAADLSYLELRKVWLGFFALQPALYGKLVSAARAGGNGEVYARKLAASDAKNLLALSTSADVRAWLYSYLYQLNVKRPSGSRDSQKTYNLQMQQKIAAIGNEKYRNAARRQALNFHSWVMRGTVEFRLKEGTTVRDDIFFWPLFCGWMVDKVVNSPPGLVENWAKRAIQGYPVELEEALTMWNSGPSPLPKEIFDWAVNHEKC